MADVWFTSDTHFGHANILKYEPTRLVLGDTVEKMNEGLVERWNSVVKPQDKVYHLGDVGFSKGLDVHLLRRLNGHKRLVMGNHDTANWRFYAQVFEKLFGARTFERGVLLTHIPVSESQVSHRFVLNVHGHMHSKIMMKDGKPDERYFNVSVECHDFTPVHIDVIRAQRDKNLDKRAQGLL